MEFGRQRDRQPNFVYFQSSGLLFSGYQAELYSSYKQLISLHHWTCHLSSSVYSIELALRSCSDAAACLSLLKSAEPQTVYCLFNYTTYGSNVLFGLRYLPSDAQLLHIAPLTLVWDQPLMHRDIGAKPFITSIFSSSSTETSECFICRDVELQASDPLRNFCDCKNLLAHHVCLSTWIQRVRKPFHVGNLDILNFRLAVFFFSSSAV